MWNKCPCDPWGCEMPEKERRAARVLADGFKLRGAMQSEDLQRLRRDVDTLTATTERDYGGVHLNFLINVSQLLSREARLFRCVQ